jgi:16S rRNA (cytosine967-C5)-methyltransferase
MPHPRTAAVELYAKWLGQNFQIDRAVNRELNKYKWEPRDRALFQELIYGVVRLKRRLEWIFRSLSTGEIKADHIVTSAVIIGLYQVLYLDRIPDHAAVNTTVDLVKKHAGDSVGRWVNAIMRRACREKTELQRKVPESGDKYIQLALIYSYPDWMIAHWKSRFSLEKLEEFLKWNNRRPATYLRINHLHTSSEATIEILNQQGIECEISPVNEDFLFLNKVPDPGKLNIMKLGHANVQDISQGLVAQLVKPESGELILDLCAAPGGKTGHMAELCEECKIVSTDKSLKRLSIIRDNVNRCGYDNVEVLPYQNVLSGKQKYDAVLVDAPCTGTGVMSRKPDLRWRKNADDASKIAKVQIELLELADSLLKPTGRIIYSTCSIEEEENEGVIEKFLSSQRNYKSVNGSEFIDSKLVDEKGFINLLGMEVNGDGVFAARLEKK